MRRILRAVAIGLVSLCAASALRGQVTVRNGVSLANTSGSPAYSAGSTYAKGDVVTSGGNVYVSLIGSNTANTPASSPTDWQSLGGIASFPAGANQIVANDNTSTPQALPNVTYNAANNLLKVGSSTTTKGFFLLASFGGSATSTPLVGDNPQLYISTSTDGVHWTVLNTGFVGTNGTRDPTITKVGQRYFIAYTTTDSVGPGFGMAYSDDLTHWTQMSRVVISGANAMTGYTWAPEFYIENPGCTAASGVDDQGYTCTAAQAVHVYYADSTSGSNNHNIYEIKALNSTLTSWGNNAGTSNAADLVYNAVAGGFTTIDPQLIRWNSTTWRLVYVNDTGCTTSGAFSCNVQYGTASSIVGPFTPVTSGDWTGSFGTAFHGAESPFVYQAGQDASGNTIWRMVVDTYAGPVGPGLVYIESHDNWTTWQSAGNSGSQYQALLQPNAQQGGNFHHGTVIRPLDVDSLRDLASAIASRNYSNGYVPQSTTVNGHALSANVTVAPADLAAGALANGMTGTTQSPGDNTTKLATDAFVLANAPIPSWATPTTGTATSKATFPGGDLFNGGVNAQTGTSYTVAAGDENKIVTFSNASAIAVALPQATTTGFGAGATFEFTNKGAGTVTITPTTSTINGASSLTLPTGAGARLISDGTNYAANQGAGASGFTGTSPIVVGGGAVSCPTCSTGSGTNTTINGGSALGTANFNDSTPAAPGGGTNVKFQVSGSNVSGYVPATGLPFVVVQESGFQSGASNVSSYTVTFPSALAASGDTAFMLVSTDGSGSVGTPAGWTVDINQTQATYARFILLHKATAGETTAAFTLSTSSLSVYFFEIKGSHTLDQFSAGGVANTNTITMPAITPTAGAQVFAAAGIVQNAVPTSPFVTTPQTVNPWAGLNVASAVGGGGRSLVGLVLRTPSTGISITPPVIQFPGVTLFTSAGVAYATFSIL